MAAVYKLDSFGHTLVFVELEGEIFVIPALTTPSLPAGVLRMVGRAKWQDTFPGCGRRSFAVGALQGIGTPLENEVTLNHGGYLAMLALLLKPDVFHLLSSNAGFAACLLPRDRSGTQVMTAAVPTPEIKEKRYKLCSARVALAEAEAEERAASERAAAGVPTSYATVVDIWRRQIEAFNAATTEGYVSDEAMPARCTWDVFHRPGRHSAPQDEFVDVLQASTYRTGELACVSIAISTHLINLYPLFCRVLHEGAPFEVSGACW
jgi:hypothetical protein